MDWLDWLTAILAVAVVLLALRNPIAPLGREREQHPRPDEPPNQNL